MVEDNSTKLSRPTTPVRVRPPVVRLAKGSLLWSVLFTINLITAPLKAYLSESLPWDVPLAISANATEQTAALRAIYNSHMDSSPPTNWTFARRGPTYTLRTSLAALPLHAIAPADCIDLVLQAFPAAVFYAPNMRRFVCDILARNASDRDYAHSSQCCQARMAGSVIADICLWFELLPPNDASLTPVPLAYLGTHNRESSAWTWSKWWARWFLVAFMVHFTWRHYFKHVVALWRNLDVQTMLQAQMSPRCLLAPHTTICFHVGDPSSIVFCHPFVGAMFALDFVCGAEYIGLACARVSQVEDLGQFCLGCLYGSRVVWFGYCALQVAMFVMKRLRLNRRVAPVDSGILALAAACYVGPVFYVLSNTYAAKLFYIMWSIQLPKDQDSGIDVTAACVATASVLGTLPLTYGLMQPWVNKWSRRGRVECVTLAVHRKRSSGQAHRPTLGTPTWLDWKLRLATLCSPRRQDRRLSGENDRHVGGSVYFVYDVHPRYKVHPMVCQRSTDCLISVKCGDRGHGGITTVRLSLFNHVAFLHDEPALAIQTCPGHHDNTHAGYFSTETCGAHDSTPSLLDQPSPIVYHPPSTGCGVWTI
ncbi:hypothetical protein H310_13886 [Aphanomyces invadans]|uniref:Uncharacterized protein n=1 Tax=Aphanomyces invadans TaxID=157072 RepID=A0A024TCA4_9STRA|nr:hypothetical protein H310_13886 [Aphanomyces invadans]ETV91639.1 hypothetical protein H310_13886 [Aphanomyces invadans]|eukprot:XP_008879758.1 hypothetical protein H310_13886 [Aphanomyces invadans]